MSHDDSRYTAPAEVPQEGAAPEISPFYDVRIRERPGEPPLGAERREALAPEFRVLWKIAHPETGRTLVEVTVGEAGPAMRFFDHEGRLRLELCACPQMGAAISVVRPDGEPLAELMDSGAEGGKVVTARPPDDATGDTGITATLGGHGENQGGRLALFVDGPERRLKFTLTAGERGQLEFGAQEWPTAWRQMSPGEAPGEPSLILTARDRVRELRTSLGLSEEAGWQEALAALRSHVAGRLAVRESDRPRRPAQALLRTPADDRPALLEAPNEGDPEERARAVAGQIGGSLFLPSVSPGVPDADTERRQLAFSQAFSGAFLRLPPTREEAEALARGLRAELGVSGSATLDDCRRLAASAGHCLRVYRRDDLDGVRGGWEPDGVFALLLHARYADPAGEAADLLLGIGLALLTAPERMTGQESPEACRLLAAAFTWAFLGRIGEERAQAFFGAQP